MDDRAALSIQLLGNFSLTAGGATVRIDQPRLQRLLAYLLLHRRHPRPRQQVAFTLWPDTNEEQALKNLRTLLTRLRQSLPNLELHLDTGAYALQWRQDAPSCLDVADFEAACADGVQADQQHQRGAAITAYARAVQLYTGDLTPGWYDEWLVPERERLRDLHKDALEQLAHLLAQTDHRCEAIGYAQQLLRADPLHEAAYRQLMQLHLDLDDRAAALRVYHTCATTLRNELGVDPSPATHALYLRSLGSDDEPALPQPARAVSPSSDVMPAPTTLVGRQAEWETLRRTWQSAASSRAQIVLISGEAGMGKTRLAEEMLAWVERQGAATAAVARCYASGGSLAYTPVVEWLRSPGVRANVQQLEGIWRSEMARLLPDLLANRPDLSAPGPMTEAWQRQRFFQALNRGILGAASENADAAHPLLLLLDDAQWCDRETLDWLHFLLQANAMVPLLVLATVRVEETQGEHPLTPFRLALEREGVLHVFNLAPLDVAETAALAADLLGHDLAQAQARHLFENTEGNPLFVVETVRAGIAERETGEPRDGERSLRAEDRDTAASLPPKVRAVIQRRLALLSPGAQALAEMAAVLGRAFTFAVLAHASGQDDTALVQGLDELWRRRIVREQGADAYDFSHDKIRAVAYADLSPMRRRAIHLRSAEALIAVHQDDLNPVSSEIAAHFEHADRFPQAIAYYRQAASAAQDLYANGEAIRLYDHLLGGKLRAHLSSVEACELMLSQGEVWRVTGQWDQAEAANRAAMALAETLGEVALQARSQRALADVMRLQGQYDEGLAWLTQAQKGFETAGDWRGLVSTLWTAAEIHWFKGNNRESLQTLEHQLRIADEIGDSRGVCEALDTMGMVYWSQGDWDKSIECCHRSIAIADPLGYHLVITRAAITLGNVYSSLQQPTASLDWYLRAGLLARQIDDRQVLSWAVSNSASSLLARGDYVRAFVGFEQATRIALEIGDRWTAWLNYFSLGEAMKHLQAFENAEYIYQKVIDVGRRIGSPSYFSGMLLDMARLLFEGGRPTEAMPFFAEAITLMDQLSGEHLAGADSRFDAQILSVRLRHALGELAAGESAAHLRALLEQDLTQRQQAVLHYELWRLAPDDAHARAIAADLNKTLYEDSGYHIYRQRYVELTGMVLPDPPPLPDVSELIPNRSPDFDGVANRLAPLLAQLQTSLEC